jgi:L-cysteine S-thiosulfotransferase
VTPARGLAAVLACIGAGLAMAGAAAADSSAAASAGAAAGAVDTRRSGYDFMGPSTQAMQRDDALNPALLWAADGEAAWSAPPAAGVPSCAGCHGAASTSMRGVASRYPAYDPSTRSVLDLGMRIEHCRTGHQRKPSLGPDSRERLALESYVALQSRGLPIAPPVAAATAAAARRGAALWGRRIGQLDLACADCHDRHAGGRLGGAPIPQAHPTGYPLYRLEWQAVGSLQRRLRACMTGVRAEPFAFDAAALVDLEAWLMQRAGGMTVDAPAVRP